MPYKNKPFQVEAWQYNGPEQLKHNDLPVWVSDLIEQGHLFSGVEQGETQSFFAVSNGRQVLSYQIMTPTDWIVSSDMGVFVVDDASFQYQYEEA